MATKSVSDLDDYTVTIAANGSGPTNGVIMLRLNNGTVESATVGGAGADISFASLGTAGQRSGFLAIIEAARVAARQAKGFG